MGALHELAAELHDLEAMIEEGGDEIDHDSFLAALTGLNLEVESKIANLGLWMLSLKSEAEAIKAEEQRLTKRRKGKESRIASLRQYIAVNMTGNVKTPLVTISRRKGGVSLVVDDESLIPEPYTETKTVVVKADVRQALTDGYDVPGARLVEGQPTVTVR